MSSTASTAADSREFELVGLSSSASSVAVAIAATAAGPAPATLSSSAALVSSRVNSSLLTTPSHSVSHPQPALHLSSATSLADSPASASAAASLDPSTAPTPSVPVSTPSSLVSALHSAMESERSLAREREAERNKSDSERAAEKEKKNEELKSKFGKWAPLVKFGYAALAVVDYTGEMLADALGITDSRFQYVIDAQERHKRMIKMERENESKNIETTAQQSTAEASSSSMALDEKSIDLEDPSNPSSDGSSASLRPPVYSVSPDASAGPAQQRMGEDGDIDVSALEPPEVESIGIFKLPTGSTDTQKYNVQTAREMLNAF